MSKPVKISKIEWQTRLLPKLRQQHGDRILIRDVCRRELGFTTREHNYWDEKRHRYVEEMLLDIYDESARTHLMLLMEF